MERIDCFHCRINSPFYLFYGNLTPHIFVTKIIGGMIRSSHLCATSKFSLVCNVASTIKYLDRLLGGEFHKFDMLSFLITITTAVGLLAVATTIVDLLMLYVLPEKERYQEAKYESTEEFERQNLVPSALNQLMSRADRRQPEHREATKNCLDMDNEDANELKDPLLEPIDTSISNSVI